MSAKPKTFEEAWAEKERMGFQYGPDALEHVRFGWELHELHSAEAIRRDERERIAALVRKTQLIDWTRGEIVRFILEGKL